MGFAGWRTGNRKQENKKIGEQMYMKVNEEVGWGMGFAREDEGGERRRAEVKI
jgi:hypothetical protein